MPVALINRTQGEAVFALSGRRMDNQPRWRIGCGDREPRLIPSEVRPEMIQNWRGRQNGDWACRNEPPGLSDRSLRLTVANHEIFLAGPGRTQFAKIAAIGLFGHNRNFLNRRRGALSQNGAKSKPSRGKGEKAERQSQQHSAPKCQ